tara:strand:+ start:7303 stop:7758 length:456 start_codon:yes stop_codon:yes gene_type:complete
MGKSQFKFGQIFDPAFADLKPSDLIANLQQVASKIEEGDYTKALTNDEIGIAKSHLSDTALDIAKIEEAKKLATSEFNDQLKEPKAQFKELLETIKHKSVRKVGLLYLVAEQEEGLMYSFDSDAICVEVRPLAPKERQHSITESEGVRKIS